jgi:hypothetical protein
MTNRIPSSEVAQLLREHTLLNVSIKQCSRSKLVSRPTFACTKSSHACLVDMLPIRSAHLFKLVRFRLRRRIQIHRSRDPKNGIEERRTCLKRLDHRAAFTNDRKVTASKAISIIFIGLRTIIKPAGSRDVTLL